MKIFVMKWMPSKQKGIIAKVRIILNTAAVLIDQSEQFVTLRVFLGPVTSSENPTVKTVSIFNNSKLVEAETHFI